MGWGERERWFVEGVVVLVRSDMTFQTVNCNRQKIC